MGQHKYNIEDMKKLAESYGGECLSEKYLGAKISLRWRCSNGHEWQATPNNIKSHNKWFIKCKEEQNS